MLYIFSLCYSCPWCVSGVIYKDKWTLDIWIYPLDLEQAKPSQLQRGKTVKASIFDIICGGNIMGMGVRRSSLGVRRGSVGVRRSSLGVRRSSVVSTLDCWNPVPGSVLTRWLLISSPGFDSYPVTPPPRAAQEQELPLSEVGPSPGWEPGWILYHKICVKCRKKYKGKKNYGNWTGMDLVASAPLMP